MDSNPETLCRCNPCTCPDCHCASQGDGASRCACGPQCAGGDDCRCDQA